MFIETEAITHVFFIGSALNPYMPSKYSPLTWMHFSSLLRHISSAIWYCSLGIPSSCDLTDFARSWMRSNLCPASFSFRIGKS